jgi:hypothetical protein
MSGPVLYVFTLKFLALNWFFPHKKYFLKNFWLLLTFILCNFSVRTLKYFQKKIKLFFVHKNLKKQASKVAHNQPRPFYFTVQPRPQPTANNRFFILWNLGARHLFSHLWCESFLDIYISWKFRLIWKAYFKPTYRSN